MTTAELLNELMQKPEKEIEIVLITLMIKEKIDFIKVSNVYVKTLNALAEEQQNKLIEAETCLLSSYTHTIGGKSKDDQKVTHRGLYFLNNSKRFKVEDLNKKYNYNEELGKEMALYNSNKK